MKLFKTDLFRNFSIGFAIGAAIVALQMGPDVLHGVVPQAHAATTLSQR